jgi:phage terminase small subunit
MPRRSAASLSVPAVNGQPPRLHPPASLSEAERTIFIDLVTACEPKHFHPSDMVLLCRYCEACALAELAAAELRREGAVLSGKVSPWVVVQEKTVRAVVALSMRLRLSPQARQPNNPSRPQPTSVYDRMALERD